MYGVTEGVEPLEELLEDEDVSASVGASPAVDVLAVVAATEDDVPLGADAEEVEDVLLEEVVGLLRYGTHTSGLLYCEGSMVNIPFSTALKYDQE